MWGWVQHNTPQNPPAIMIRLYAAVDFFFSVARRHLSCIPFLFCMSLLACAPVLDGLLGWTAFAAAAFFFRPAPASSVTLR